MKGLNNTTVWQTQVPSLVSFHILKQQTICHDICAERRIGYCSARNGIVPNERPRWDQTILYHLVLSIEERIILA